jgi:hypothetical protein
VQQSPSHGKTHQTQRVFLSLRHHCRNDQTDVFSSVIQQPLVGGSTKLVSPWIMPSYISLFILNSDLEGDGLLMLQVIDQHQLGKPRLICELKSSIEITGDFPRTKSESCSSGLILELLTNVLLSNRIPRATSCP